MRVLVVEDDLKIAQYLKKGLEDSGFMVDFVNEGAEAIVLSERSAYDLITLDVSLPDMDGYQILSNLRAKQIPTPVLMLTARDRVEDRVHGLNSGADAYLVKPFSFAELLAQIRSLLRRAPIQFQSSMKFSDLELDPIQHKVYRDGKRLELTQKEFLLLHVLLRRKREVLSRAVLADQVWGINFDSNTNVVDVHIRRLRSKVDDPFAKKLIHTVRGLGYVLDDEARAI